MSRSTPARRRDRRPSPAARPARARTPEPASEPGPPSRVGATLAVGAAALMLSRLALVFAPSMWLWSLNLMRFVHPAVGIATFGGAAATLAPPVARRILPLATSLGDGLARGRPLAMLGWVLFAAALVLAAPDRVRFVGDFLLRQGTVEVAEQPSMLFPQALPLDVALHYSLPRFFASAGVVDANGAARALGAVEAATLAWLAAVFARALSLQGAVALLAAATVFFGGYLGMFTGFSKAFAELCLLVAATGAFGLRAIREGRGLLPLGIALAVGVALHRSALGLVPAALFAYVLWLRTHGHDGAWRRPAAIAAFLVPIVGLAVMVPRIIAVVRRWDAIHFAPAAVQEHGGVLAAALAGARPWDLMNLLVMLSPLAPLLIVLLPFVWTQIRAHGREAALLVLLAGPFLAFMPFIHPAQGLFRDWDDFAATGVALSLLTAWVVGRCLAAAPRHVWLAVPLTLAAAAPTVQWLAHNADVDRGFARVRAFMLEPPPRPPAERGTTWDFLGIRNFRLERWDAAVESFSHAAETSPSPRILQEWALSATMQQDYATAQRVYKRMLEKAPQNELGWLGLGTVSLHLRDWAEARHAAARLLELHPGHPDALRVLDFVDQNQAAVPPQGGP